MTDRNGRPLTVGAKLVYEGRPEWTTRVVEFRHDSRQQIVAVLRDTDFVGRISGAGPTFTDAELRSTPWVVAA